MNGSLVRPSFTSSYVFFSAYFSRFRLKKKREKVYSLTYSDLTWLSLNSNLKKIYNMYVYPCMDIQVGSDFGGNNCAWWILRSYDILR